MAGHFSDVQRLLKNRQNQTRLLLISDSTLNLLRHAGTYISI